MKLFDSVIKPVVAYGSNIWLAESKFTRTLTTSQERKKDCIPALFLPQKRSSDPWPSESLNLTWTIGVGTKTSNTAVWGDTGKMPLAVELYKQLPDYLNGLQGMSRDCHL